MTCCRAVCCSTAAVGGRKMQSRLLGAGSFTPLQQTVFSSGILPPSNLCHLCAIRCGLVRCHSASSNGDAAQSIEDNADSGLGKLRYNKRDSELPKELQGLVISQEGDLVDTKTGKVINEFGATRFDVAVRALRGELDPAPWVDNSERNPGVLLSKLVSFPTAYTFQVVGKTTPEAPKEAFVADMVALLARVCEVDIQQDQVQVQERLKGKYVSMSVQVMVRAPEVISRAYEEIGKDSRVKMKF